MPYNPANFQFYPQTQSVHRPQQSRTELPYYQPDGDGRAPAQSPLPAEGQQRQLLPPMPEQAMDVSRMLQPPAISPRSRRQKEKQNADQRPAPDILISRSRPDTTMSQRDVFDGVDVPLMMHHEGPPARSTSTLIIKRDPPVTEPVPRRDDPTRFILPDVRHKKISAPVQPRITDVQVEVDRDTQQQAPTFSFNIKFTLSMQPGDLR